jgi:hypothetical protein
MKRSTKVLIIGREAHIVSCASNVDCKSADSIVDAMKYGTVKILGHGIVVGDTVTKTVDVKGESMHFPNRAEKLTLIDVSRRQAFAKLADIMPVALKKPVESEWHEEKIVIDCFNCHTGIPGKRRCERKEKQERVVPVYDRWRIFFCWSNDYYIHWKSI